MSMVPDSKPKKPRKEIEIILAQKDIPMTEVVLVGIRGYYKDSMGIKGENDIGMYDDAVFLVSPRWFNSFNANTDPQKAGQKLAKLDPGKYYFYKGKHKGKYDALRSYPEGVELPCTRDGVKSHCSAINVHHGGYNDTFSAGCQTIYPTQWDRFITEVYDEMTNFGQKTILYLLIEN